MATTCNKTFDRMNKILSNARDALKSGNLSKADNILRKDLNQGFIDAIIQCSRKNPGKFDRFTNRLSALLDAIERSSS